MLIVLFIISLIPLRKTIARDSDGMIFTGILSLGLIVALLVNIYIIVDGRVLDQKINMYVEENKVIETQIETVVSEYMDYESETLTELKGDSAISLVSLYPELKSDKLIMAQIKTYQNNNAKIKELKESKINVSNAKWWVYFGK